MLNFNVKNSTQYQQEVPGNLTEINNILIDAFLAILNVGFHF